MYYQHTDGQGQQNQYARAVKQSQDYKDSIRKTVRSRFMKQRMTTVKNQGSADFKMPQYFQRGRTQQRSREVDVGRRFQHGVNVILLLVKRLESREPIDKITKDLKAAVEMLSISVKDLDLQLKNKTQLLDKVKSQFKSAEEKRAQAQKELASLKDSSYNNIRQSTQKQRKEQGRIQRRDQMEKLKLQKLNRELLQKLNVLGQAKRCEELERIIAELKKKHQLQVEELTTQKKLQSQQLRHWDEKVHMQKEQIQKLKAENARLAEEVAKEKGEQSGLIATIAVLKEQIQLGRERRLMTVQDKLGQQIKYSYLTARISKLMQVNKSLKSNVNKTLEKEVKVELNPVFQCEKQFFKGLRARHKDRLFYVRRKKTSLEVSNIGLYIFDPQVDHFVDPEDKFSDVNDGIDIHNYAYYKPNFFGLLQVTEEVKARENHLMSVGELVSIIHHLFDSKFKEFLLYQDVEKYSQFPEFVYAWFSTFFVDPKSNKVATAAPEKRRTFARIKMIQFYKDVMSRSFDHVWEIVTFRQFLIEHQSLEQVYFYLHCRNTLFTLARINAQQVRGQVRVFVGFPQAMKLVDVVLDNYESWSVNYIKQKMKEKVVRRKQQILVESSFVLRCLLQYYRIQRINRLKFTRRLYQQCGGMMNSISFDGFLSMFDWFHGVTMAEKVKLYRECFSVGHGNVSADVIFTVCTQRNFYLKHLRLSTIFKFPVHKGRKTISEDESNSTQLVERLNYYIQPYMPALYHIYHELKSCFSLTGPLYKRLQQQGIQAMLINYEHFRNLINKSRFIVESSALRGRHFVHFLTGFTEQIRRLALNNFYLVLEGSKEPTTRYGQIQIQMTENELVEIFIEQMFLWRKVLNWTEQQLEWRKKINQFRLHCCARKIQRAMRSKLLKPYLDIYQKLLTKIESNKTHIVAELKKKYKK